MKKRIISLLLALTLCLGLLPAPVFAEEAPGAQTLEKEVVSQNEEPQPEPAPQNEEGQKPQQEPAPQNGEAGEPQPEPAPQNGEGQEPQGASEQGKPQGEPEQGEPEQGEPQGEPEQGEPQEEPGQGELPVQNVLKANAPMAAAEVGTTLTVGQQEGKLFAGVDGTASFTLSGENVDWTSLKASFGEDVYGLSAEVTGEGTTGTVTVTATGEAKKGIYTLTLGEGIATADVTVDVPFVLRGTVETESSDKTSATIKVNIKVTDGFDGQIKYEWIVNGTNNPLKTTDTESVVLTKDDLTRNDKTPSLYSSWICCRVSSGTYCQVAGSASVTINTCDHSGAILYTKEGTCRGCGQLCPEDRPFITEDGVAIQIPQNANTPFALDDWFPGTLYLWENYTRGTALHVGTLNGDGTLELQKHMVYSYLILDDFQNHSFTIHDGHLAQLTLSQAGSLILDDVVIDNPLTVPAGTNLEVKNTVRFSGRVCFKSAASLTGGIFNAGLSYEGEQGQDHSCLELLAPGYAFADGNGKIIDASGESIQDFAQVVSHTCTYEADKAGKCACGRSCPHGSLNEGYCTVCQTLVEPFAIEGKGYRSLEAALEAAQEGQTIYLRGSYTLPNPVEISKNITLNLNTYTLSGNFGNALLRITGTDVTVQNGCIVNSQAPAVTVASGAKLTVKTVTFGVRPDNVLVVEHGGHADVQNGAFCRGVLYVDGSLSMKTGGDVKLELGPNAEKISIVEGDFNSITLAGGKEYKNLLAEGSAYWENGEPITPERVQANAPAHIATCTHPDGLEETKACSYCGKACGHGNIDQETGFCKDCGYQVYKAKVDDVMKSTFQEAMKEVRDGQTVTLLADANDVLNLDKEITLNINGYTLTTGDFTVQKPLTICGGGKICGAFYISAAVRVQKTTLQAETGQIKQGGSLCIEQGATVTLVSVFQGGSLKLEQGTIDTLTVDGGGASLISGTVNKKMEVVNGKLLSILDQGKALEKDGKIVDGTKSTVDGPVTVVDHTHMFDGSTTCPCGLHCDHSNVTNGICDSCGTAFVAKVGATCYQNVGTALERAGENQTVQLLQNAVLDRAVTVQKNITLRVGAFRLSGSSEIQIPDNITINSAGNGRIDVPLRLTNGTLILKNAFMGTISSLTVEGGATLQSDEVISGRVEKLIISKDSNVQLSGGSFGAIRCSDGPCFVKALLPDEYAFYDTDTHTAVPYSTVISQDTPLQNVEVSACGHTAIDDHGNCAYCGMHCVAERVVFGTTSYYKDLQSALDHILGGRVKLLEDIKNGTFAVNGNGTLDLNGKTLHGSFAPTGSFTIQDSSQTPGKIESLVAGAGTKISGGSFDEIHVQDPETLKSILADNCYYTDKAGTVISVSETGKVLSDVRVAQCDHHSVRENKGTYFTTYTCNCGQVTYRLTVTVGENKPEYFGKYNDGFAYAAKKDGVVRFLTNGVNGTIEVNAQGMVTIDMENRSYSANDDRSLVIKSGSTVKLVGQGSVMSTPEAGGGGSGSSGTLEYSVFIPVTVEAGGTFVLPEKNLDGGENMAKPSSLTVQSGGTAELQGGSTQWTDVYGTLKISGGSHSSIHQYEKGQLNITGGQITRLEIHGDIPQNALSGGSYVTISVWEFQFGESQKFRDVTFADFQKMLVSGKVFQNKQDQAYPKEAEETPNYGMFNYKKELNNVNVTAAPFTGVEVVCQLGNAEHSGSFTTVYGGQEENFCLKARLLSPAAEDQKVGYRWYRVQDGSKEEVGQDETYQLKQPVNVGVYTYQVTTSFNGYELTSAPFTVTVGKAPQTADVEAHDETVSGKNDGYVTLKPQISAYEMRKQGEETFTPCEGNGIKLPLPAGTYELRMKETEIYKASDIQTVTVRPGPKLTVTMPESTEGYTLTANKTALDWKENLELTLTLEPTYYRNPMTFGVMAGEQKLLEENGKFILRGVTGNVVITVDGVFQDKDAPTMRISSGTNSWMDFADPETLYTKDPDSNQFKFWAVDSGSGLESMWYCFEKEELDRSQMETLPWNPVEFDSEKGGYTSAVLTREGEYYLYGKALDNVGNVTYVRTGKLIRETQAPTFEGPANGSTCYVTQKIKISDNYLVDRVRVSPDDEKPVGKKDTEITLPGKRDETYTVTAWDACGNTSTYTVTMKPMGDLTREADALQPDSIQKADLETLDRVEAALKALDLTDATEDEKITVEEKLEYIWALRQVLDGVEAVETRLKALPEQAQPDAETLEDTEILPARQALDALTAHQKTLVEAALVRKLETLEAGLKQYAVTQGDGQTWNKGSKTELQFTVAGQMRKWTAAALDGKTLDAAAFAVAGEKNMPMTLTLHQEFLQGLEPGQHTLEVFFGTAATPKVTFTVEVSDTYLDVTGGELAGTETVTVNGVNYPVEQLGDNSYVNLPENGGMLTANSYAQGAESQDADNYPTGMRVYRITREETGAKLERVYELDDLLQYAGCSIRLNGTKGIRMITSVDEKVKNALTGAGLAGFTLEEYGTVIMRGVGTPTLETGSHNYAYKRGVNDPVFAKVNGRYQYTNVLVGFSLEDCKQTLTLRPYIILKDRDGVLYTLYGGCVSRSIGYIAKQNENAFKPGTEGYRYIHEIIDAVYGQG